jgi:GMP synthase (glutamine-hydrolysing)
MKRVILVRHNDQPLDDRVYTFLINNGLEPVVRRPFAGEKIGELGEDIVGGVIYGGPYNVYETEKHPFLKDEYRWIDACLKRDMPLLGICQGAQQIAWHLGAPVGPLPGGQHEFGYYEVRPTAAGAAEFLPQAMHLAQSHFHMFGIPKGAERLASSELFENQAFRYGERVYGLQFHAEVTIEGFRRWQATSTYFGQPGAQSRDEQNSKMHYDGPQASWFFTFLGKLFGGTQNVEATPLKSTAAAPV